MKILYLKLHTYDMNNNIYVYDLNKLYMVQYIY